MKGFKIIKGGKMQIKLSLSEYNRRLDLYEKTKGKVIPREENRLYNYILAKGKIPRITKTGTLIILLDNPFEK